MDTNVLINAGLLVVSIAAVVVSLVQAASARSAKREARQSAQEAAEARDETVKLAERQVRALERANELEEAKVEKPSITFEPTWVRGETYSIVCTGLPADAVLVTDGRNGRVIPMETEPRDLERGDTIRFMVSGATFGNPGAPRLRVEYTDPRTGTRLIDETDLNL